MTPLATAWAWYLAACASADRLTQLAKHWDGLPWRTGNPGVTKLERNNVLGTLTADALRADAGQVQRHLDDLAVLFLFSVFEAEVRDHIEQQLRPEVDALAHPALKSAGAELLSAVAEGSFFRVVELAKAQIDKNLVEQVNQVRRYRNWVAHGRRPLRDGRQMENVSPRDAFDRLARFLARLTPLASPVPTPTA